MDPETSPTPTRCPRVRRALAVAAGVAMVPALYAVATATTGGGRSPSTVSAAHRSVDDRGTEREVEHGVEIEKPQGGATTPTVPEVTTPPTTPTAPSATTPTTPEQEVEHSQPEPGDDNGVDAPDDDEPTVTVPSGAQSFSSVGGSITVAVNGDAISLTSSAPAAGFTAEVHDNGPSRVEVRFTNGDTEWRIRVELGSGGLTSEVTQH
jgi:hypothetical protein